MKYLLETISISISGEIKFAVNHSYKAENKQEDKNVPEMKRNRLSFEDIRTDACSSFWMTELQLKYPAR